jgi:hypothetical protein
MPASIRQIDDFVNYFLNQAGDDVDGQSDDRQLKEKVNIPCASTSRVSP